MESSQVTKLRFIKVLLEKEIALFHLLDIQKIFNFKDRNTLKHLIRRLKKEKIIERLAKNKYLFLHVKREVTDFEIANFLAIPSYISLESALSYYGIITQFPYRISSITITKAKKFKVRGKIFLYSKIKKGYFKDFVKIDNFLIASRKKALFDYLYFIFKGLRPSNMLADLQSYFKEKEVKNYILKNGDKKFIRFLRKHVKL